MSQMKKDKIQAEITRLTNELEASKQETALAKEQLAAALAGEDGDLIKEAKKRLSELDRRRNTLKSDRYLMMAELKEIEFQESQ